MTTEQMKDQYTDLLPADDPAAARVVGDLHALYATATTPAHIDAAITGAVAQRAAEQIRRPAARRAWFPRWQLRTAAVVAALLLATIAGGAYALAPLLDRAVEGFANDQGLQHIEESGLWTDVDLSQTIDNYTIHLQRVYADGNRVVVGYTIDGPEGQAEYNFYGIDKETITTASGTVLPWYYGGEAAWDISDERSTQAMIMMFDAAAVDGNPAELDVRLDVSEIYVYTKDTPIVAPTAEELKPDHIVTGPFSFNFTVPFQGGQIVEVNQTVVVDTPSITTTRPLEDGNAEVTETQATSGIPVTLERVVITPSETRTYWRLPATEGIAAEDWTAFGTFSGDGWTSDDFTTIVSDWIRPEGWGGDGSNTMSGRSTADGQYILSFLAPLHEKHGEWTISIPFITGHRADQVTKLPDDTIGTKTIIGPWVFKFVVP